MHKLEELSLKLSGSKLFSAISGGMGGTMGLLMTGAVFQIICVIGATFFGWDTAGTLYNFFYTPYRWTMGILSFFMAYCISASYSKQLRCQPDDVWIYIHGMLLHRLLSINRNGRRFLHQYGEHGYYKPVRCFNHRSCMCSYHEVLSG